MDFSPFDIFTSEYEDWVTENINLFQSELLALKQVVPPEIIELMGNNDFELTEFRNIPQYLLPLS
jgi:hypothetical protein